MANRMGISRNSSNTRPGRGVTNVLVVSLLLAFVGNAAAFHVNNPIRQAYEALLASPISLEKCFSRPSKDDFATRLSYRDVNEDEKRSGWWGQEEKIKPQQAVVDDYLEFLDKRYHRLYKFDEGVGHKFPIFKWLTNGPKEEKIPTQTDTDNAFYALGVADLASKALLLKHHLRPLGSDIDLKSSASDVETETSKKSSLTTSKISAKVSSLFRPIGESRKRLLNFQGSKTRAAAVALLNTFKSFPQFLLRAGGGKNTLSKTLSVFSVVRSRLSGSTTTTDDENDC